ncbi:hypothetical protein BV22DRAFT_1108296 [Leucogyrophana mollusca]|uniref:Uncharacterized protein n=1 Tax=Leucogyrophana mollusca TaxID=85980 RepID=A0ACB8AYN3_9AGAM|nr:hypothetical protein BV22DRAFT_1108296 [Leucogyrophana mollusca]
MKRLAARDFEDLLQCAIPVFDRLIPQPDNSAITQFLFVLAHWHGLAKLRLHMEDTLKVMDEVTVTLGQQLCAFARDVCPSYRTTELPKEAAARQRREIQQRKSKLQDQRLHSSESLLRTLGDYPNQIR